jgi:hypothetical protein
MWKIITTLEWNIYLGKKKGRKEENSLFPLILSLCPKMAWECAKMEEGWPSLGLSNHRRQHGACAYWLPTPCTDTSFAVALKASFADS